ncbi:hypothetical protein GCE86_00145 [Micromonospora terminaliae]|uniref:Uncharacterized protein n=1 Tax=Micromonospora terminaliae TaxID=1914461 RepID=A0AAJ2ZKI5_9ACTN|nr:hypothetical protein [Micromonospora terminaliae]NES30894.1 hypothetical protein [Micromonospora terminaliae]QGL45595.1 hypothetical protein GCE86_00145 [Micromonospora terminaliae]
MQPEGPYRFTETLGECQVGRAWAALDGQDRPVTVAVLDGAAATDQRWREAFGNAANMLAQAPGGHRYVNADFTADRPWVAYSSSDSGAAARLFQTLGMDYQPVATAEVLPQPPVVVAPPPAEVTRPISPPPQPISGAPQLPWAPQPWAMAPQPVSAAPISPVATPPTPTVQDPLDQTGGRRIAPVERPTRSRTGIWATALALTAVVAAGIGLLAGGALGSDGGKAKPGPSASAALPVFEANQASLNKTKFDGDLAPLAEPWLDKMGGCAVNGEVGGPKLPADEKKHVFCRYGGVSLHFSQYGGSVEKDAARAYRQQLNLAGGALAPGLREAARTTGGTSGAAGSYVEYAFKGDDERTICGVWWDRDDAAAAMYMETLCESGLGGNWDALRDLWRRTS